MHFKLLNALCKQQAMEDRDKARSLHNDLLTSGMDRILVVRPFHPPSFSLIYPPLSPSILGLGGSELTIDNEKSINDILPNSTSRAGSLCGFTEGCIAQWEITSSY
jgi:hypothetical protein